MQTVGVFVGAGGGGAGGVGVVMQTVGVFVGGGGGGAAGVEVGVEVQGVSMVRVGTATVGTGRHPKQSEELTGAGTVGVAVFWQLTAKKMGNNKKIIPVI